MARKRNRSHEDLQPYEGCRAEQHLGMTPLGVGFLTGAQFPTGPVSDRFVERLAALCQPAYRVCTIAGRLPCAVDRQPATMVWADEEVPLGGGEIRVLGDEDIFAAPDLIYHYVTEHGYQPPAVFIKAVEQGPAAGSPEHRAYVRVLQ